MRQYNAKLVLWRHSLMASVAPLVLATASLFALHVPAQAQTGQTSGDTTFVMGDVLITASPVTPRYILTSVDTLGGDVVQTQNVDFAFELVSRLPGVATIDFGQGPTNGAFFIRGFGTDGTPNAIKLLIDGIPSNDNAGFQWAVDQIIPLDVAGIELVRGTSDPRYGLFNIAGNVNFLTRTGGNYIEGKTIVGSFDTVEGLGAFGVETGSFSQNYAVSYRQSDGYQDHSAFDRFSITGKWFYNFDMGRIGAIARYYTLSGDEPGYLSATEIGQNPRQSNPISSTDGRERSFGQYSLHADLKFSESASASLKTYYSTFDDVRFVRFSPQFPQREDDKYEAHYGAIADFEIRPDVTGVLSNLAIQAGADVQRQDIDHTRHVTVERARTTLTFDREYYLSTYGGYIQAVIEPTPWLTVTPAYRADWIDGDFTNLVTNQTFGINDFGTIHQPKISAVVRPVDGLSLYANYGRTFQVDAGVGAFKIPPRVLDLDPSINEGYEGGIRYVYGNLLQARVAIWRQTATGEVERENLVNDLVNVGSTRRQGFDFQVSVNPTSDISLWGSFSKQIAEIVVPAPATPEFKGNQINTTPEYLYSGGIDYQATDDLKFSLWGRGQSDYYLEKSNTHGKSGSYVLLNFNVNYQLLPGVELTGEVTNITNGQYDYAWWDGAASRHSPQPGRAYYLSLTLRR